MSGPVRLLAILVLLLVLAAPAEAAIREEYKYYLIEAGDFKVYVYKTGQFKERSAKIRVEWPGGSATIAFDLVAVWDIAGFKVMASNLSDARTYSEMGSIVLRGISVDVDNVMAYYTDAKAKGRVTQEVLLLLSEMQGKYRGTVLGDYFAAMYRALSGEPDWEAADEVAANITSFISYAVRKVGEAIYRGKIYPLSDVFVLATEPTQMGNATTLSFESSGGAVRVSVRIEWSAADRAVRVVLGSVYSEFKGTFYRLVERVNETDPELAALLDTVGEEGPPLLHFYERPEPGTFGVAQVDVSPSPVPEYMPSNAGYVEIRASIPLTVTTTTGGGGGIAYGRIAILVILAVIGYYAYKKYGGRLAEAKKGEGKARAPPAEEELGELEEVAE